jgi:single-stranded DNA-binding protein
MTNPANSGSIIGRLAQDIKTFANTDGSRKLLITVAVEDNFKSGSEQKAQTSFVQVETFVGAGKTAGGWDRVHKGDQIAVQFHIDAKPYVNGQGETVYPQKLIVDGFPTFLEPKSVTEKRAAEHAIKAAQDGSEPTADERVAALEAELAEARGTVDYAATAPFGG